MRQRPRTESGSQAVPSFWCVESSHGCHRRYSSTGLYPRSTCGKIIMCSWGVWVDTRRFPVAFTFAGPTLHPSVNTTTPSAHSPQCLSFLCRRALRVGRLRAPRGQRLLPLVGSAAPSPLVGFCLDAMRRDTDTPRQSAERYFHDGRKPRQPQYSRLVNKLLHFGGQKATNCVRLTTLLAGYRGGLTIGVGVTPLSKIINIVPPKSIPTHAEHHTPERCVVCNQVVGLL